MADPSAAPHPAPVSDRPPPPTPVTVPPRLPAPPAPDRFDSLIVLDFPPIFAELRENQFKLLWCGSREGFKASQFHGRRDGHASTLTVISDTKGNSFEGRGLCLWNRKWEHTHNRSKADTSEHKSSSVLLKSVENPISQINS